MKNYGDIDSKFRYVIIASLRAKELLKGAKPKIKIRSKNLVRVAQKEVQQGLIDYELIAIPDDEVRDAEDGIFIGEEINEPDKEPDVEADEERDVKKAIEAKPEAEKKKKKPETTKKKKKTPAKK